MFIYGEAQVTSPSNLNLDGYVFYLHKSKPSSVDNFRRGMVIFYHKEHRFGYLKLMQVTNLISFGCAWQPVRKQSISVSFIPWCPSSIKHT